MPFTFGSYQVTDTDGLDSALAFDELCLASYDFAGQSAPDGVDFADIGRLIASRMVGFTSIVAADILAEAATAPWAEVPMDARLEDADPASPLYAAACNLLDHFQAIPGVGDAISTKLLALKRLALYPVKDERVLSLYTIAAAQHSVRHPTLAAVRVDLLRGSERQALTTLRQNLLAKGTSKASRLAQLPDIRLRDVVAWQHWEIVGPPPAPPPWPGVVRW